MPNALWRPLRTPTKRRSLLAACGRSNDSAYVRVTDMKIPKQPKVEPEHLIGGALILGVITWFTFSALGAEQIRMGIGGRGHMITRCDQPSEYWFSVGWFLLFSTLGWFAIALNAWRLVRNRNRPQPKDDFRIEE